jgi:integrase/recombinase XerD
MAKQAKVLTSRELTKVFKVTELTNYPYRNRLIVAFSFYAGLRAIELANLKIDHVLTTENTVNDIIVLSKHQTKGCNSNVVHVGKKLQREIKNFVIKHPHIIKNRESRLFRTQRGVFSSQSMQNLFRQLYQLANISNASSHSGRRSFITNLSEKGISTRVIQELARHSSMVTTQRYIDVSNDKLKNAVNLI